jgi:SAM-dependent methyltransferase
MTKINIGCGMNPTKGWKNYDNSFSLKLSRFLPLAKVLYKIRFLDAGQMSMIRFFHTEHIHWADATKRIPEPDASVEVVYSSHMLEHFDPQGATQFLGECRRVLKPGGVIRLALPDIEKHTKEYLQHQDADKFIAATLMCVANPRTLPQRLRLLLVGARHHQWMYDGKSLTRKLASNGFTDIKILPVGQTTLKGCDTLDLREREEESVYVEAVRA